MTQTLHPRMRVLAPRAFGRPGKAPATVLAVEDRYVTVIDDDGNRMAARRRDIEVDGQAEADAGHAALMDPHAADPRHDSDFWED